MNAELTWEDRDRMLRDAHRRHVLAEHRAERAFGPIVDDPVIETEFPQGFDDADGVL